MRRVDEETPVVTQMASTEHAVSPVPESPAEDVPTTPLDKDAAPASDRLFPVEVTVPEDVLDDADVVDAAPVDAPPVDVAAAS